MTAYTLSLFQRYEVSVEGAVSTGGSLTSATSITSDDPGAFIATTKLIDNAAEKVLDIADFDGSAFKFIWIENNGSASVDIQITISAGTGDDFLVFTLVAGKRLVFSDGSGEYGGTIDTMAGTSGEIDEVWARASGANTSVHVAALV